MFKVEDLKPGMLVQLLSGEYGILVPAHINGELCVILRDSNTGRLGIGTSDLRFFPEEGLINSYSIIRVYDLSYNNKHDFMEPGNRELLYDCSKKEMTIEEIEKELGYPVKIVKEH